MSLREQVAAHEYLGTTEDVTAGGSSLVGGETLSLPVLVTNGAVIFPTQQLPLKLFGAEEKLAIDRALSHPLPSHRNLVFVLTRGNVPIERNRIEDRLPRGVPRFGRLQFTVLYRSGGIIEIRKLGVGPAGEYNLVATGRYRGRLAPSFHFSSVPAIVGSVVDVEILPDLPPSPLPSCLRPISCAAEADRRPQPQPQARARMSTIADLLRDLPSPSGGRFLRPPPARPYRRTHVPCSDADARPTCSYAPRPRGAPAYLHMAHAPAWAYKGYTWQVLARRVVALLFTLSPNAFGLVASPAAAAAAAGKGDAMGAREGAGPGEGEDVAPLDHDRMQALVLQDPVRYSFEIAAALPIDFVHAKRLHDAPTVIDRFRAELEVMGSLAALRCIGCAKVLGDARNALALGPRSAGLYVNAHGYAHDILTLGALNEACLFLHGRPSSQDTWFPGYTWTIATCAACGSHLGWRYDAVQREFTPQRFFGLRREAVMLGESAEGPGEMSSEDEDSARGDETGSASEGGDSDMDDWHSSEDSEDASGRDRGAGPGRGGPARLLEDPSTVLAAWVAGLYSAAARVRAMGLGVGAAAVGSHGASRNATAPGAGAQGGGLGGWH